MLGVGRSVTVRKHLTLYEGDTGTRGAIRMRMAAPRKRTGRFRCSPVGLGFLYTPPWIHRQRFEHSTCTAKRTTTFILRSSVRSHRQSLNH